MAWLSQREPGPDLILLRDYPRKVVRIDCRYCDHSERCGLASLVRRYGPAAALTEVLAVLVAECPRQQDWHSTGPCGAGFPDLPPAAG
jgi:hypothetical protein